MSCDASDVSDGQALLIDLLSEVVEEGSCDVGVLNNLVSAVIDRVLDKIGDSVDLVEVVIDDVYERLRDVVDGILDRLVRDDCVNLL